jgi:hypothetical protein
MKNSPSQESHAFEDRMSRLRRRATTTCQECHVFSKYAKETEAKRYRDRLSILQMPRVHEGRVSKGKCESRQSSSTTSSEAASATSYYSSSSSSISSACVSCCCCCRCKCALCAMTASITRYFIRVHQVAVEGYMAKASIRFGGGHLN